MQMCYSLTMSYYFFGHQAATAISQEEQTGLLTGLGDFIHCQAPYALTMPAAQYEDYYRHFDDSHRRISADIGGSLKGEQKIGNLKGFEDIVDIGILGYIVLYSLTLYNVSEETLHFWQTPDKDIKTIKKVKHLIFYVFFLQKSYLDHEVS